MPGFTRRFTYDPGVDIITLIEGINIIDLPPPAPTQGVGTGVVCCVGEFTDMTYGVQVTVDTGAHTVVISTKGQPVEIYSAADLVGKLGGFDETIGNFGGDMGNGFVELRNKRFFRLVAVPINLCSSKGARFVRQLPTNSGSTNPAPAIPMSAGSIPAGTEFKDEAGKRIRTGAQVTFSGADAYSDSNGNSGASVANAAGAVTQIVSGTTDGVHGASTWITSGVAKGDMFVLGQIGGAGALGANAGTYRVVSVDLETQLTVEKLDGTSFAWTTGTFLPYRLHVGATGDSAGFDSENWSMTDNEGYRVPMRPLTTTVAAWTTGATGLLTPIVVPTTPGATTWAPLSGLAGFATPESGGIVYTASVQAINAPNHANIDALYQLAFNSLLTDLLPGREVNIVWSARKYNASVNGIHAALKNHVDDASARGIGRSAIISPSLSIVSFSTAVGDAEPGVGATNGSLRDERVEYAWPGVRTLIPEAVNFKLATSDGKKTTDGILDTSWDGWCVAVESNLAPERNPGQGADPVPQVLAPVLGFQRGVPDLDMPNYITMRARGIMAPRFDPTDGSITIQSGVTTSLKPGEKNVNRRRMADYIEDSIARAVKPFNKLPVTQSLKDGAWGTADSFLLNLKSPNNPSAQRINDYKVDITSGNTPDTEKAGIFVMIVRVQTTPTADFIKLVFEIGDGVQIT